MLNWRPVVDYELREIEFDQREIEYEKRRIAHEQKMRQLDELDLGLPRFRGHRSGIRGGECTGAGVLLLVIDRAEVVQR